MAAFAKSWRRNRHMAEVPDQTTANSETMKQNDDGLSASSKDVARDQWSSVVRTQTRFNEIIHRTRQLTMTAVAAAFGAAFASFATKSANLTIEAFQLTVPSATLLVVLGWTFLLIGYLMDRLYYYPLLLSAVVVGEDLENTYDLPAKLTTALSKKVTRRRANIVVQLFYIGAFLVGLIILLALTFGTHTQAAARETLCANWC